MADSQPIKDYVSALEALRRNHEKKAGQLLAEAMGAEKPSPLIKEHVQDFLKDDTVYNDIALQVVAHQAGKRRV